MNVCAFCQLSPCACRTGETTVKVGGADRAEGERMALAYLARRGWTGELIASRRRRTRLGIMGYHAYDLRYRVARP